MTPEEQKQIEVARWLILKTVGVGGHLGATETMIRSVVEEEAPVTVASLRNEIDYLEKRKLVEVEKPPLKSWRVRLTRDGRDIVDYQVECEAGIARPSFPDEWAK